MKTPLTAYASFLILLCSIGCQTEDKSKQQTPKTVKEEPVKIAEPTTLKAPIINLLDTIEIKRMVLCLKDSSKTIAGMNVKLADIYNKKLTDIIKSNKLKIMGPPMAWHSMQKKAYFFEAGIPVDKAPTKLCKAMYMKNTSADSAIIAHFWGPAELNKNAYDALADFVKEKHKTKTSSAYEIYVGNPFAEANSKLDPYKLLTDIVMPYK
jgi:effector-binding domain-containing protein